MKNFGDKFADSNQFPEEYWQVIIEQNDIMTQKFFKLKEEYGNFSFADKLVKKIQNKQEKKFFLDDILELNYYSYEEEEQAQMLLFDLSRVMYEADIAYRNLNKSVLTFVRQSSLLNESERLVLLLISLSRVVVFWGNTFNYLDDSNAYKTLYKKIYQQIKISLKLLDEYANISDKHQEVTIHLGLELHKVDNRIRGDYYILKD